MFRIEMLPARQGDALWIEYGQPEDPHRVLCDAGTPGCWPVLRSRIERLPRGARRLELLIVSHIDTDHIGGVLPLLEDRTLGVEIDDVWFNGFRHLPGALETMGPVDGERLTSLILDRALPWNDAFGGSAAAVPRNGPPPQAILAGGLKLTVLAPSHENLERLRPLWASVVREAGLDPARPVPAPAPLPPELEALGAQSVEQLAALPFKSDTAEANGSSIAVLAEYEGRRALLCADAFPRTILEGLARLFGGDGEAERLHLDAFKLPHHGSRANLSPALIQRVQCMNHLISSDGTQTRHPNPEALARVIVSQDHPRLVFNYRTKFTEVWDRSGHLAGACPRSWTAEFPDTADAGQRIELA